MQLTNPRSLQPGHFTFDITGVRTGTFTINASIDLTNWSPIFTGNINNTTYTDTRRAA